MTMATKKAKTKAKSRKPVSGATMEHGGRKVKMMRTPWWTPWGDNGEGPGAVLAGIITNLFIGQEKKIGGKTLEPQHCLTVMKEDTGECLSVGCSASLKYQLCEVDADGAVTGWKPEVKLKAYVYIRYDGEGKAARKGQSAPHLFTAGIGE